MRSGLPAVDMHAHVDPQIDGAELDSLGAVVFAVTRSLTEAQQALDRHDRTTIWGVGCHPGVATAQRAFQPEVFGDLISTTPFVGELGLDARSGVPMPLQQATLRAALGVLRDEPRIVSLHSYEAAAEVLDLVEESEATGVILHWWLGNAEQTRRATELGCWFSVNASSAARDALLRRLPLDRLFTETDHPFGDRRKRGERRPGAVDDVERRVASMHGLSGDQVRVRLWQNLGALVRVTGCSRLLPAEVRARLAAVM